MMTTLITHLQTIHPLMPMIAATSMIGACAGVLGCFTLLRGKSLFGDAMAHASLPGIATMFLLTSSKNPALLLVGGSCASLLGAACMHLLTTTTRLKMDAILGIILSFFFGLGLVLMTIMQRTCNAQQAVLGKFLFGNATLLLHSDIILILIVGTGILATTILCWKELSLFTFDHIHAASLAYSNHKLDMLLTLLLIILIGIGMQTVGVILITSLLIAPAAAARQWTKHLHTMACMAACLALVATTTGTIVSYYYETLPTGPTMVVVATAIAFVSILCTTKS